MKILVNSCTREVDRIWMSEYKNVWGEATERGEACS